MTRRPYRMTERAEARDRTHRRIVEAAMQLHEEVGARATTISAIAGRAGVQRLTVYRHFPDEDAVFQACTAHWLDLHPPPDAAAWAAIADPAQRLAAALAAFYRYYGATRRMWAMSHRDVADVPALQRPMAAFADLVGTVAAGLAEAFGLAGPADRRVRQTIRHALAFPTWADLDARGLDDAAKIELVGRWVAGASGR